jgi:hypothetical protein
MHHYFRKKNGVFVNIYYLKPNMVLMPGGGGGPRLGQPSHSIFLGDAVSGML